MSLSICHAIIFHRNSHNYFDNTPANRSDRFSLCQNANSAVTRARIARNVLRRWSLLMEMPNRWYKTTIEASYCWRTRRITRSLKPPTSNHQTSAMSAMPLFFTVTELFNRTMIMRRRISLEWKNTGDNMLSKTNSMIRKPMKIYEVSGWISDPLSDLFCNGYRRVNCVPRRESNTFLCFFHGI